MSEEASHAIAWTMLGDVADFVMGQAPPGNACNKNGVGTLFVKAGEFGHPYPVHVEWTTQPLKFGKRGDVFICVVGATAGKLNLGIDCAIGRSVAAIRPVRGIDTRFVYYQLLQHVLLLRSRSSGSAQGVISSTDLERIRFWLVPTSEQVRIADKLDELLSDLDAGVKALEGVRAKLKQYRAAVLKAAVEGTLTAEWRAQHPDVEPADKLLERILLERRRRWEEAQVKKFAAARKTPPKGWREKYEDPEPVAANDLPHPPTGWEWSNLDGLIVDGPQNGAYFPAKQYGQGTAILRIDDYQNGWLRDADALKRVAASPAEEAAYSVREGDLVINRVNSMTHLGKCVAIPHSHAGVLFESNMMRARLASELSRKWVELYLHSFVGRRRLTKNAKWAVNQASINQEDVKRTPVPLPPFAEQVAIVEAAEAQLSVIDHLESDLDAKLKSAAALRQSILKAAFEGKLIPQDPADEPASELLKRIAVERFEREGLAKEAKAAAKKAAKPAKPSGPRRGRKAKATKTGEVHGLFNDR